MFSCYFVPRQNMFLHQEHEGKNNEILQYQWENRSTESPFECMKLYNISKNIILLNRHMCVYTE